MNTLITPLGSGHALARARQLLSDGLPSHAEVVLRAALQAVPADAALNCTLGRALAAQQRHAEALICFQHAVQAQPLMAEAHGEMGQSLRALGRSTEATASLDRAASLEPGAPGRRMVAQLHRGTVLEQQGQTEEALALFTQVAQQFPNSADAWSVLGVAQAHLREPEVAQPSLARALQLDPDRIDVMEYFARTLMDQKQYEDAAIVQERMLGLQPDRPMLAGWLLHTKYLMGDWLNLERLQRQVETRLRAGDAVAEPFGLQGYCADPAILRDAAVAQATRSNPPRPQLLPPLVLKRSPRIRLGYLCGEFREQATSVLLTEVLERHDPARFEVHAFDNGWDDGGARRRRIEAACKVQSIRHVSDLEAGQRVRAAGIDILINLNGYFGLGRSSVFSMRAAPVQVNYLGFPGTIGAPYIDYIVADRTVIPEAEREHYVEKVVYLPQCYQPNDSTRAIAATPGTRAEAELPESAFVFCCLNNAYKILPEVFDIWMRLLQQVPGSVLLLFGSHAELQANLRHEAQVRGVAPERILFAAPWRNEHHLRRLQLCDLFLDTWPYNAHTTGSDALFAGLPVLTCTGRSFPSRVGASLLQAVGLPELITEDLASYENMALRLATESGLLRGLRARLQQQLPGAALYDTPRYTRALESAFEQMMERAWAGLPPASFSV
jgi:protein O-GlcNAc transferase